MREWEIKTTDWRSEMVVGLGEEDCLVVVVVDSFTQSPPPLLVRIKRTHAVILLLLCADAQPCEVGEWVDWEEG